MPMTALVHVFGALALETAGPLGRATLSREGAEALGGHAAIDLQRLLPGVGDVDLALAGAHFDPAELLRPGWPVHAALSDLAQRAPGSGRGRVIALGAHDGAMPMPALQPEPELLGGPLRVLPFALLGDAATIAELGRAMEERLLETGMAGAATALFAQEAFGGRLEHVRYLSLHDLVAMIAMQYEHAGLSPLWPLIEAALLAPESEEWLDAPPEPLLHWRDGEVRAARLAFDAWCEHGFAPEHTEAAALPRAFAAHEARWRQYRAVLGVHGIAVNEIDIGAGDDPRATLR
jgi:hypothetical protein